jgi:hypothetical protein
MNATMKLFLLHTYPSKITEVEVCPVAHQAYIDVTLVQSEIVKTEVIN